MKITKLFIFCALALSVLVSCKKENQAIQQEPLVSQKPIEPPVAASPDSIMAYLVIINGADTVKTDVIKLDQ